MKKTIFTVFCLIFLISCGKKEAQQPSKQYTLTGGVTLQLPVKEGTVEEEDFVFIEETQEIENNNEKVEVYLYKAEGDAADVHYTYAYTKAAADVFDDANIPQPTGGYTRTEDRKVNGKNCSIFTKSTEDNRYDLLLCTTKNQQWVLQIDTKNPVSFVHGNLGEGNSVTFHDDDVTHHHAPMKDIVTQIINSVEIK
ncbi:hypothetical protein Emin_0364 [Elusimicrobium minutum Pei191]|uniref:Lipoprotein n=1 Tax=Elusimicrobium minutum (strain Pei191) TaxID=445932 RepID=B2KB99_ELUMP|nr:hypothetical protein [Elusimicrobium minutum]ACC97921.1 hypothetical protein Emin_0364 [Elusimicrobium minutum Pei191]